MPHHCATYIQDGVNLWRYVSSWIRKKMAESLLKKTVSG